MTNLSKLDVFSRKHLEEALTIMRIMEKEDLTKQDIKIYISKNIMASQGIDTPERPENMSDEDYEKMLQKILLKGAIKADPKPSEPCKGCGKKSNLEAERRRRKRGRVLRRKVK